MEKENLKYWEQFDKPPDSALKKITGGRLSGKSDINPQWRYKSMTEVFGVCGVGWKYTIEKLWTEPGVSGRVFCFAQVNVYIREGETWSDPVPGIGGSMLVDQEKSGLHCNDEGFKMAVTDALSVALKMFGMAAEVYLGNFDGTKYINRTNESQKTLPDNKENKTPDLLKRKEWLRKKLEELEYNEDEFVANNNLKNFNEAISNENWNKVSSDIKWMIDQQKEGGLPE